MTEPTVAPDQISDQAELPRSIHSLAFDAEAHTHRLVCENPQAWCHFYPECDCESWGADHEHAKVWHGTCWMDDWFTNNGVEYVGDDAVDTGPNGSEPPASRTGVISASFEGDYIEWEWALRA